MGRKNRPFYRVIAIDSRKRREGLEIERLGWYNPLKENFSYQLNEERVLHWLKKGAQPSDATKGIFKRSGLSYKWHLTNIGKKDSEIEALMEEWTKNQKSRENAKAERKKLKKTAASLDDSITKEEPAAEAPVAEEPVAEAPAAEEPVAEEPVAEEPAAEEPVAEEPVAEEPAAEEPAAEEPVAEEPAAEEPAAEEPVAEEPVAEEPVAEEPVAEEPAAEEPVAEKNDVKSKSKEKKK